MATTEAPVKPKKAKEKEVDEDARVVHPVTVDAIKPNHLMAFTYYVKVDRVSSTYGQDIVYVKNVDDGDKGIEIRGAELITKGSSADQFHEEKTVTKTKAAEILVSSHNRPFTVEFIKDNDEVRTLRGRLIAPEPLLGRSLVEDLDVAGDKHRPRLVDHRTIKYLIVDGVKYTVK